MSRLQIRGILPISWDEPEITPRMKTKCGVRGALHPHLGTQGSMQEPHYLHTNFKFLLSFSIAWPIQTRLHIKLRLFWRHYSHRCRGGDAKTQELVCRYWAESELSALSHTKVYLETYYAMRFWNCRELGVCWYLHLLLDNIGSSCDGLHRWTSICEGAYWL